MQAFDFIKAGFWENDFLPVHQLLESSLYCPVPQPRSITLPFIKERFRWRLSLFIFKTSQLCEV
ncbi:Uncharacterized protein dnl_56570 [Desulfonema limicola]|uniref:Uncharacterized protein n=1 Tax=Desulfonema limicola TaxID=45656 RepID=A0A975GJ55_9BACT|nr:Uncharacterized protein dnl_56570 [Desulfonema limicola]